MARIIGYSRGNDGGCSDSRVAYSTIQATVANRISRLLRTSSMVARCDTVGHHRSVSARCLVMEWRPQVVAKSRAGDHRAAFIPSDMVRTPEPFRMDVQPVTERRLRKCT